MALGVDGVRVGVWTSPGGISGCTVVLPPPRTIGAIAIRGSAPGTREAAALSAAGKVDVCHAVVLSGGSAFGLATADGVVRYVEEQGGGYPTPLGLVPIVGAAIVYDDSVAEPGERPDAAAGYTACAAAVDDDPPEGSFGVGAGCTVAKLAGPATGWRSGQGVALRRSGDVAVGALIANNAVGEVTSPDGGWLLRTRAVATSDRPGPGTQDPDLAGPTSNTVIGCIVTNARLTKRDVHRVADLGHSGIVRAIRPAHTEADGDAMFCLATGEVPASTDLVAELAAEAVEEAVRRGPAAAAGSRGVPGLVDTPGEPR